MKFPVASYICASELALTVALVVFVMLTVLLSAIIILLCASKSFRAFLFREKYRTDEKPAAEQSTEIAPAQPEQTPQPKPRRKKHDDLFGGVPTVPLTFMGADLNTDNEKSARQRNRKGGNGSNDGITTVEIPAMTSAPEKTTYTPRTVAHKKSTRSATQADDSPETNKNSKPSRRK